MYLKSSTTSELACAWYLTTVVYHKYMRTGRILVRINFGGPASGSLIVRTRAWGERVRPRLCQGHWFTCKSQSGSSTFHSFRLSLCTLQDLTPEIEKISTFCKLNRSQAFLQLVSKKTSFLHMKRNKPVGEWFNQWHKSSFSIYRQGMVIRSI